MVAENAQGSDSKLLVFVDESAQPIRGENSRQVVPEATVTALTIQAAATQQLKAASARLHMAASHSS
jgi:hypothetical protein